jgi:hypothetical protein
VLDSSVPLPRRSPFLAGVFLIACSALVFQIVQTRILSVIAWYYLAFFAISVAMLGMTVGAVWVYLRSARHAPERLATTISDFALAAAVAMPASLMVQLSLITSITVSLTTFVSWALLMAAMAVPYVFAGVALTLALTRSPFRVGQVYGVDLLGAAAGCILVVFALDVLSGPSVILLAALACAAGALCLERSATEPERARMKARSRWRRPASILIGLAAVAVIDTATPLGLKPILVKDDIEPVFGWSYERWNSYSRIVAYPPEQKPSLTAGSPLLSSSVTGAQRIRLNIDGAAATAMHRYDGTPESLEILRTDLVNLAYNLPGRRKSAVIGVGGGRDVLSAHLFGVPEIVGVELNPTFVDLLTREPRYRDFANLHKLPNLRLYVDDARSWFASSKESFDLIQMSMIDTWAATGAGAFSLSENGLYTLEGWRTFLRRLNDDGVFTVSRWYSPNVVDETGRMIGLAVATLLDAGYGNVREHLFVANGSTIATLILSRSPFTPEQITLLEDEVRRLGFEVLLSPGKPARSTLLEAIVSARSIAEIDRASAATYLDLSVTTDRRPFFFNQLRLSAIPVAAKKGGIGVVRGNLLATAALAVIFVISLAAVALTVLLPLRRAVRAASQSLVSAGTAYFGLIGLGFMFAEISLVQHFSVYLGHPIYSLSVCLFSLILAAGLGSLASDRFPVSAPRSFLIWALLIAGYLLCTQLGLANVFAATAELPLASRIAVALAVLLPLGFLLGFGFPTGVALVAAVDRAPMPWFWGINGATGVLASVVAVMVGIAWGIDKTLMLSGLCYLLLIPAALVLARLRAEQPVASEPSVGAEERSAPA